jgi:hypothetical protein
VVGSNSKFQEANCYSRSETITCIYFRNRSRRVAAERHNSLDITPNVEAMIGDFQVGVNNAIRPYRVLNAGVFGDACKSEIKDEALKSLVAVGAFDQLTHADDQLVNFPSLPQRLAQVYRRLLDR